MAGSHQADPPHSLHNQPVQMDWAILEPAPCIACSQRAGEHRHVGKKLAGVAFIWLKSSCSVQAALLCAQLPLTPKALPQPRARAHASHRSCGNMHAARAIWDPWFGLGRQI